MRVAMTFLWMSDPFLVDGLRTYCPVDLRLLTNLLIALFTSWIPLILAWYILFRIFLNDIFVVELECSKLYAPRSKASSTFTILLRTSYRQYNHQCYWVLNVWTGHSRYPRVHGIKLQVQYTLPCMTRVLDDYDSRSSASIATASCSRCICWSCALSGSR